MQFIVHGLFPLNKQNHIRRNENTLMRLQKIRYQIWYTWQYGVKRELLRSFISPSYYFWTLALHESQFKKSWFILRTVVYLPSEKSFFTFNLFSKEKVEQEVSHLSEAYLSQIGFCAQSQSCESGLSILRIATLNDITESQEQNKTVRNRLFRAVALIPVSL